MSELPRQYREIKQWLLWQGELIQKFSAAPELHFIYDPVDGSGKTTLAVILSFQGQATDINYFSSKKDLMDRIRIMPKSYVYFVDLPRARMMDSKFRWSKYMDVFNELKKSAYVVIFSAIPF